MKPAKFTLSILALLLAVQALAFPVHKKSVILTQADGSTFSAVISGDEFSHSTKDFFGHNLIQDSESNWCYATILPDGSKISSGYIVGKQAPSEVLSSSLSIDGREMPVNERRTKMNLGLSQKESILKRLQDSRTKAGGPIKKHCMILLVEFKDKKMTYTRQDFVDMVTKHGYNRDGATGSVDDYFNDQFKGDFEFSYEISDIITLDNDCAKYFSNDSNGSDANAPAAVAEACQKAADAGVDFSVCDDDNDGEVDNVFLFVAGLDEADGGGEDCVWSHMYYLQYTSFKGLALNGKVINNYAISTELRKTYPNKTNFAGIGTFCHEYSHALGLMDMYDTDYEGSGGRGNGLWWSTGLMDGGSNNNEFNTPAHYSAIDYDSAGIGNPETLKTGRYTLEPISVERRYLKMETGVPGEYYLIECRNNKNWDRYIGGKGLLIYHIDKSSQGAGGSDSYRGRTVTAKQRWADNEINCRPERQCAELVSATSGLKTFTSDGYLSGNCSKVFFPSSANNSFTAETSPAFIFWNGTESPLALVDIKLDGENVKFTVANLNDLNLPDVSLGNVEVFQDAAILQWESDDPTYEGNATVSWGSSGDESTELEVEPYEAGRYALVLDGLQAMTAYNAVISFKSSGFSSPEVPVNFTTKVRYDGYPFIFLNNVKRTESGVFEKGAQLPLRVYNLKNVKNVLWYMGNTQISVGKNGYYELNSSGRLKAVVEYSDGSKDILMKEVNIQ